MKILVLLTFLIGYAQSAERDSLLRCSYPPTLTTDSCEFNCKNINPSARFCLYSEHKLINSHPIITDLSSAYDDPCFVTCLGEEKIIKKRGSSMEMEIFVSHNNESGLPIDKIGVIDFGKLIFNVTKVTIAGEKTEASSLRISDSAFSNVSTINTFEVRDLQVDFWRKSFNPKMFSSIKTFNLTNWGSTGFPKLLKDNEWGSLETLVVRDSIDVFPVQSQKGNFVLYKNIMSTRKHLDLSNNDFDEVVFSPLSSRPPPLITLDNNKLSSLPGGLHELLKFESSVEVSLANNELKILRIAPKDFNSDVNWGKLSLTGIRTDANSDCESINEKIIEFGNGNYTVCVVESRYPIQKKKENDNGNWDSDFSDALKELQKREDSKIVAVASTLTVILLFIVGFAAYFLHHRRKTREEENKFVYHQSVKDNNILEDSDNINTLKSLAKDKELSSVRLAMSDVYKLKKISSGAFGEVWIGKYKHQEVAIKCLRSQHIFSSKEKIDQFVAEIKRVATLSHPNIVTFIGASWTNTTNLCMITEFLNCGDLCRILHTEVHIELSWKNEKLKMALDIASGLAYLHSQKPLPFFV